MSLTVFFAIAFTILPSIFSVTHCEHILQSLHAQTEQSEISGNFSMAINNIVRKYFVGQHKLTVFNYQINVKCSKNLNFFQNIMEKTVILLEDDIAVSVSTNIPIPANDEMQYSVLLVDSFESLKYLYSNIIKYELYIHGSFFIVLHSLNYPWRYYNDLTSILDLSWSLGISHVNILVYAGKNSILLFNGIPFSVFHCHQNLPEIFNKFQNGQWQHLNFYRSKIFNLYGCPLICSTWENMPYFRIHPLSTSENKMFQGLEGRLIEYLMRRMNFTINFRWMTKEQRNRTVYDQHGVFKELFHNGTDFTLGGYHYRHTTRDDPYKPTTSFYPSVYYFVISSRTDPYNPFEKLLLPFDIDVWGALLLLCVGGNIIIFIFSRKNPQWQLPILGRRNKSPYYNLFIVLFGGSVVQDPKVTFSRFLLMIWLFSMSTLRTVYQSLMFHVLKHDLHKQPPNDLRALKYGYTVLMSESVYQYLHNFKWLRDNAHFLNTSELESFELLKYPETYAPRKYAILTAYEYFGYYDNILLGVKNFHLMPQIMFTQHLSIYLRKNSIYLNRFNIYIKSFINEGLMNRWERALISNNRFYRRSRDEIPKPMNLRELYGGINLFIMGLGVGLLVFIGELTLKSVKRFKKYRIKLWRKRRLISAPFEFVD